MNRNLIIRTITGLAFVAIVTACVLWHPFSFGILFALFSGLTTWEFCSLMNKYQGCQINRFITPIASVYLFGAIMAFNANIAGAEIFIPYLITLVYLLIVELYFPNNNVLMNWAFTLMSQLYIALPFALLNTLAFFSVKYGIVYNPVFVLSVFIFIWFGDSAAYGFGTWLGRHKLFPRISPKKSWEGCIAAFMMALVVSQVIAYFSQTFSENGLYNHLAWAGLALVVIGFGTWGDLVESLIKRRLGIKDSGKILPGHGGMLDRFDSSLLAIPMAVVYIYTMNEILG